MVKALSGNLEVDSGELLFEGRAGEDHQPAAGVRAGNGGRLPRPGIAPHLNPVQNLFLGREIPRKGFLGPLGFMDEKAMRARAVAGFQELGGTVRSFTAPVGAMSGGQRQQIAIVRAIAWAGKVVFLDEPTAALGVVQTKNVLDTIKRIRDKGIAVVLISHSMPHVLEVANRVQVMRLGTRVATIPAKDATVEQLVGAMTGALDSLWKGSVMSVITTTPPDKDGVAVSDPAEGQTSLLKRISQLQSVWIFGVLVVIVIVLLRRRPGNKFLSTDNFSLISQNVAVWAVLGVGMTFVIITSGIDLSIGSVLVFSSVVGAKVMEKIGGDGWGVAIVGILVAAVTGMAWGTLNGVLIAKGKIPPLIVTLGALSVALGLAQVITKGIDIRAVPGAMTDYSTYIKIFGMPSLPFVALVVVVVFGIILHKTKFGRYTYAIGSNEEAARRWASRWTGISS